MQNARVVVGVQVGVAVLVLLAASSGSSSAQLRGPLPLGTWALDVARSKVDYGVLPKAEVRTYELTATGGIRLRVEGTDGTGGTFSYGAVGDIDGRDYPLIGAGTRNGGDTVSWTAINAYRVDAVVKKAGAVVNATRLMVSTDGTTLTITETGTGPNGRPTHGVRVYKKR
jgi:hypothetical protein